MADLKSSLGEKFIVKIANTEITDKVIAIIPAYFDTRDSASLAKNNAAQITAAGFACDAALDDGIITGAGANAVTVTSANTKMSVRAFLEYLKHNGRLVKSMSVSASNSTVFDQTMEIVNVSPLTGSRPYYLPLGLLRDRYTTLSTVLDVDTDGLKFGYDTLVMLNIPTGTELTISFMF